MNEFERSPEWWAMWEEFDAWLALPWYKRLISPRRYRRLQHLIARTHR